MHHLVTIFGTRPEAVKLCPLCLLLKESSTLRNTVLLSGQHTALTDRVLESFSLTPDYRLPPPSLRAPLAKRTAALFSSIAEVLSTLRPSGVIVHGDTATAYAAATASFLHRIPVFHVEAGLRSKSLAAPFPEEYNRRAISLVSTLDFAPTDAARENLLREGKPDDRIFVTGNTVVDALRYTVTERFDRPILRFTEGRRIVLFTVHRRENGGEPMRRIFSAVKRLAQINPDLAIICPVHHSPPVRQIVQEMFSGSGREILFTEPLDVVTFHNLLARSSLVLTDSGGLQEEAPTLGVPVVLLRETTERPEGIAEGLVRMVGSDEEAIISAATAALAEDKARGGHRTPRSLYGDGYASRRICDEMEKFFKENGGAEKETC